jgi:signal transduction histidine kinase
MRLRAPRSLFGQFVALHIATAAVAAIALTLGASALLHGTADHYQRQLLRGQADRIAAGRGTAAPGLPSGGMAFAVIDAAHVVRRTQGPLGPRMIADAPLDTVPRFFRRGPVRGLSLPDKGGWIVVAQDGAAPEVVTDDIVRAFLKRFALLSLPVAALVPLIGALLVRRLTRRMNAVSAIAAQIGPRTLDLRLPARTLPLEVAPLAAATNAALDRLAEGFRVQAAFAADVAHELRTPLAVVRLRADAVADDAIRAAMLASVDRAARVIGQLLSLADLEHRIEDSRTPVDLRALAEEVVGERAAGIVAGGRSIAL